MSHSSSFLAEDLDYIKEDTKRYLFYMEPALETD